MKCEMQVITHALEEIEQLAATTSQIDNMHVLVFRQPLAQIITLRTPPLPGGSLIKYFWRILKITGVVLMRVR